MTKTIFAEIPKGTQNQNALQNSSRQKNRWYLVAPLLCSLMLNSVAPCLSGQDNNTIAKSSSTIKYAQKTQKKTQIKTPTQEEITENIWALYTAISKNVSPDMERYSLIKKVNTYYYVDLSMFYPTTIDEIADKMQMLAIADSNGTTIVNIVPDQNGKRIYMDTRKVYLPEAMNELDADIINKVVQIDVKKSQRKSSVPYLTGKGIELYANIPSKLVALLQDGKVVKVYPAAFGSPFDENTHSPVGHFAIGDAEINAGWIIPPRRAINFQVLLETGRFPALKYSDNTIKIDSNSMFCLMGHTKTRLYNPHDETIKLHGRIAIFPATKIPVPAGMERSIKDDIPDQTTNACICVFDGNFFKLEGDRDLILNNDIMRLMSDGKIKAVKMSEGEALPLRGGGTAYLSTDKWGNPTWFKEKDGKKEIASFKYDIDWDNPNISLVAWIAKKREDSSLFKEISRDKVGRILIDYRSHYIEEENGDVKVVFYYDPYGRLDRNKEISIVLEELNKMGFGFDVAKLGEYFNTATKQGAVTAKKQEIHQSSFYFGTLGKSNIE